MEKYEGIAQMGLMAGKCGNWGEGNQKLRDAVTCSCFVCCGYEGDDIEIEN